MGYNIDHENYHIKYAISLSLKTGNLGGESEKGNGNTKVLSKEPHSNAKKGY